MSVENTLDRTATRAVGQAIGAGSRVADATIQTVRKDIDRLELSSNSTLAGITHLPSLSVGRNLAAWADGALTRLGLGRLVWGDATAEKAVLNRARATVMRAAISLDGTGHDLADLSSQQIDNLMSQIAAKATSEVRGAKNVVLTVAAIGPYGRRAVGPFSSLDFAVLVDKGDASGRKIAAKVASKITDHLKALGETTQIKPGLRPGSYLSPAGLYGSVLAGTPADLAKAAASFDLPAMARWALHDLRPIYSNSGSDLSRPFTDELQNALGSPLPGGLTGTWQTMEAQAMANSANSSRLPVLIEDSFNPTASIEGPVALAIKSLALKAGVPGATSAQRVDGLVARGKFSKQLGEEARSALSWAGNAKVRTQISGGTDAHVLRLEAGDHAAIRLHLQTVAKLRILAGQS